MTNHFPRIQLPTVPIVVHASTGAEQRGLEMVITLEILVEGLPERCIQFKCSCSWTFFSSSTCKEEDADRSSSRRFCSCRQTFCSSSLSKIGRNKTSPARLFKLNKLLSKEQRDLITQYGWGGMLMVKASEMPVDLSIWLMSCYNPISIIPRCYPSMVDLSVTRRTNFCQFAIDQINTEVKKMGVSKKSVCCCLQHLVILYLDYLDVDEPVPSAKDCLIHATTWDDKLIQGVVRKDTKPNGEFGKLRFKYAVRLTIRDSLFVGMTRIEEFVSSKFPRNFPYEKKRKLAVMIGELCTNISNRVGKFVEQLVELEEEDNWKRFTDGRKRKRQIKGPADENDNSDNKYNTDEDGDHGSENEDEDSEEDRDEGDANTTRDPPNAWDRNEDCVVDLENMPRR